MPIYHMITFFLFEIQIFNIFAYLHLFWQNEMLSIIFDVFSDVIAPKSIQINIAIDETKAFWSTNLSFDDLKVRAWIKKTTKNDFLIL